MRITTHLLQHYTFYFSPGSSLVLLYLLANHAVCYIQKSFTLPLDTSPNSMYSYLSKQDHPPKGKTMTKRETLCRLQNEILNLAVLPNATESDLARLAELRSRYSELKGA
jgi:hypothetical protein